MISIFLSNLAPVILGGICGGFIGAVSVNTETLTLIISSIIGGYLGYLLYNITIIMSTVSLGSLLLLYAYVNIISLITSQSFSWTITSYSSYFVRLIKESFNEGTLDAIWKTAAHDLIAFIIFACAGFFVQIRSFFSSRKKDPDQKEALNDNDKNSDQISV